MQGRYTTYQRTHYRSVFLSNCYIGSPDCDAQSLLDTLKSFDCDYLFLIGNIVDGHGLRRVWTWDETATQILNELAAKSARGTKIIYIAGDADSDVPYLFPRLMRWQARVQGFRFAKSVVHILADGRHILLRYGRRFEQRQYSAPVSNGLQWAAQLRSPLWRQAVRACHQLALRHLDPFENRALKHAASYDVDGIMCAVPHVPRYTTHDGLMYASLGSWRGSSVPTFMAETLHGELKLVHADAAYQGAAMPCQNTSYFPVWASIAKETGITFHEDCGAHVQTTAMITTVFAQAWRRAGRRLAPVFYQTKPQHHIWTRLTSPF